MKDVSAAIRRLRERLGLTQVQFARQLGVSRLAVVQWEAGNKRPREQHLDRLETLSEMNGVTWEEQVETAV